MSENKIRPGAAKPKTTQPTEARDAKDRPVERSAKELKARAKATRQGRSNVFDRNIDKRKAINNIAGGVLKIEERSYSKDSIPHKLQQRLIKNKAVLEKLELEYGDKKTQPGSHQLLLTHLKHQINVLESMIEKFEYVFGGIFSRNVDKNFDEINKVFKKIIDILDIEKPITEETVTEIFNSIKEVAYKYNILYKASGSSVGNLFKSYASYFSMPGLSDIGADAYKLDKILGSEKGSKLLQDILDKSDKEFNKAFEESDPVIKTATEQLDAATSEAQKLRIKKALVIIGLIFASLLLFAAIAPAIALKNTVTQLNEQKVNVDDKAKALEVAQAESDKAINQLRDDLGKNINSLLSQLDKDVLETDEKSADLS